MPSRVKLNLILSYCLWMLLRTQAGFCQTLEPLELAKRIFDKEGFADLPNYIEGNDYNGHPNGQDLPKNSTTRFQLLSQTDQRAVVALTVLDVYIANKKNLPAMSADLIIMLREIGDGWYVYKTT
ncbi:hypothetical protein [Spirosoma litoris]